MQHETGTARRQSERTQRPAGWLAAAAAFAVAAVATATFAADGEHALTIRRAEVCDEARAVRAPDEPWSLLVLHLLPFLLLVAALCGTVLARRRAGTALRVRTAANLILVVLVPAALFGLLLAVVGVMEAPGYVCHHGG